MAEAPSQIIDSRPRTLDALAPERLFDLRWAATVVEHALRRLREECEGKGRLRLFETLRDISIAERCRDLLCRSSRLPWVSRKRW